MTAPARPLADAFHATHSRVLTAGDRPMALAEYERDPIGFGVSVLGIPEHTLRWSVNPNYPTHQWDGTVDPIVAIGSALAEWQDVGVESGTGTGKSFFGAVLVLWFLASFDGARVFTFAPKEDQLRLYIWAEITKLWPRFQQRFPTAELTDLRIRMLEGNDSWAAFGYAVGIRAGEDSATKAQGMHARHMLLVYEETPGIPLAVIEAGKNTATAPHNLRLALGNPDHQLDALHLFAFDTTGRPRPGVTHVRISALDHPNVVSADPNIVPGAVSQKAIDRRRFDYGETGRLYTSRVRGQSPAEAADALVKLEWVQAAQARWLDEAQRPLLTAGPKGLGVDVANSENGDQAAIARGQGRYLREVVAFACPNANDLGFRVSEEAKRERIEGSHIGVDPVGVGAGCINEMWKRDVYARSLNGGERVESLPDGGEEEFNNLRSAMYWQLSQDLKSGEVALPPDAELAQDLITPTWKTRNGKIIVESKEDIRLRLPNGRSTNKGDAVVYWNWCRHREPIASDRPKHFPTREERILNELKKLDDEERNGTADQPYYRTLRQG